MEAATRILVDGELVPWADAQVHLKAFFSITGGENDAYAHWSTAV